jgi:hypothetical protein
MCATYMDWAKGVLSHWKRGALTALMLPSEALLVLMRVLCLLNQAPDSIVVFYQASLYCCH